MKLFILNLFFYIKMVKKEICEIICKSWHKYCMAQEKSCFKYDKKLCCYECHILNLNGALCTAADFTDSSGFGDYFKFILLYKGGLNK
jgi:hypothetical protein